MTKRRFGILPGAASLLLVIMVIAVTTFALLALSEGGNEKNLAERAMIFACAEAEKACEAQKALALLDEALFESYALSATQEEYMLNVSTLLPSVFSLEADKVSAFFTGEMGRNLYLQARILPFGSESRYEVVSHVFCAP